MNKPTQLLNRANSINTVYIFSIGGLERKDVKEENSRFSTIVNVWIEITFNVEHEPVTTIYNVLTPLTVVNIFGESDKNDLYRCNSLNTK